MRKMSRPHDTAVVVPAAIDPSRKPRRPSSFDCDLPSTDEHAAHQEWNEQTCDLARDREGTRYADDR